MTNQVDVASGARGGQKVVIVNGSTEMLELLESVLDPGRYDVVFLESNDRAYSQIKRLQPNLAILCMRIEDVDGFRILSMLKLDAETQGIPVLTYTTEYEGQDVDGRLQEADDDEEELLPLARPALPMN
jgi:PleD family two-component response regulator